MPVVCPACNKANQTEATCQRCGCDVTRLHHILEGAQSHLSAAVSACASRDWPEALIHAKRSWQLCHTPASARLAFIAAAATGETAHALRWRTRASAIESGDA